MKGVVLRLAPWVNIVDLTHEIAPGDIRAGAFALAASYAFFPRGTVHVVVVDPGVGTSRRALAVRTLDYFFVGPDNGVLSWALAEQKIQAIHALENEDYFLPKISSTFHGRDVFAPVAAHLARGVKINKLGRSLTDLARLGGPEPKDTRYGVQGEVLYVDRFGNAITNISTEALRSLKAPLAIFLRSKRVCPLAKTYQSVHSGELLAVVGSTGFLEVAVNGGSAAKRLGLRPGSTIEVRGK